MKMMDSRSCDLAGTDPKSSVAIMRVVEMGARQRLARNAARASFSGGRSRSDLEKLPFGNFIMYHLRKSSNITDRELSA